MPEPSSQWLPCQLESFRVKVSLESEIAYFNRNMCEAHLDSPGRFSSLSACGDTSLAPAQL